MDDRNQAAKKISTKNNLVIFLLATIALLILGYFVFTKQDEVSEEKTEVSKSYQSIAVLPFVNMSGDADQEYFSDGMTEGILNSLAHLKGLKVTARTSSFQFKGTNVDINEVGEKLGVQTVLEGSVQRQGDRIRVTAQLINVEDNFHFWSEQYNEQADDIFALQDKIAKAVAQKLEITVLENERVAKNKKHNPTKEAYELYLKGRISWNLGTPHEFKKGIDFFQQAIALDPLYAAAYSGVADCYTALGYGSFLAPKEAFPKALEAATKALQLDSTLAEPHASLGYYRFYYDWDWAAAEQEFRIAIASNPNYEIAYDWYGYYLTAMERYDEANFIFKKAEELDPLSVPIKKDIGFSSYYRGDYDVAMKELKASLEMNPKLPLTHIWLGRTYQAKKMYMEAIEEYKNALKITPDWPVALAQIGNVYGVAGKKADAYAVLDSLNLLLSRKYVTSYGIALVYAGLGEKEQAFAMLNRALEERSHWLVWLKTDPRWSSLRSDKRFSNLVNSVGLPETKK